MLVCPQCRNENAEGATQCATCGRDLTPAAGGLGKLQRRESVQETFDMPAPKAPNPLAGILTLALILGVAGGAVAWLALRPNPCSAPGTYSSPTYGYCVEVPQGWSQGTQEVGGATADTFQPKTGRSVVLVSAEQVDPGVTTQDYADRWREAIEAQGYFPEAGHRLTLDDAQAVGWEIQRTTEEGVQVRERFLAVVRGQSGWLIQFAGDLEGFEAETPRFQSMLESWNWK